MSKCLISGSFDPITNGHLDLIRFAAAKFDEVIVGVFVNEQKEYLFDEKMRTHLCSIATQDLHNVSVISSDGFVADFCRKNQIDCIVRGFRSCMDYKYETEMAAYNFAHSGVLTYLIPASYEHLNVSSSAVRCFLQSIQTENNDKNKTNMANIFENYKNNYCIQDMMETYLPQVVLDEIRRIN